eukprot:9496054-Pyramimonas_sp.AAC.1
MKLRRGVQLASACNGGLLYRDHLLAGTRHWRTNVAGQAWRTARLSAVRPHREHLYLLTCSSNVCALLCSASWSL